MPILPNHTPIANAERAYVGAISIPSMTSGAPYREHQLDGFTLAAYDPNRLTEAEARQIIRERHGDNTDIQVKHMPAVTR